MPAERAWGETNHAGDNRSTERIRCNFLTIKSTVCNVIDNSQFVMKKILEKIATVFPGRFLRNVWTSIRFK